MELVDLATLLIRTANAVLWSLVVLRLLSTSSPVSTLTRRMVATVLFFGMLMLVLGALTPFGMPGQAARLIYTAFTAYAAIVALSILTTKGAL